MTAIRLAASIFLLCGLVAPAHAERITHRTAVPAGAATPTGGSFSVQFPIPYNDVELKVEDPEKATLVVRLLSGMNSEEIRFSATQTPVQDPPKPLDILLEAAQKRHGGTVANIKREKNGETESLSFELNELHEGSYFRSIRTKTTGYVLVVQFPNAMFGPATKMKDAFFDSFKIIPPK